MREKRTDSNETALPDIDRIKGNYLDCYFAIIDSIRSYSSLPTDKALQSMRNNMIVLSEEIDEELSSAERTKIRSITKNKGFKKLSFIELYNVWRIFKHRLKVLRVTDIKMREGMGFDFK